MYGSFYLLVSHYVPYHHKRHDSKQQQEPGMSECYVMEHFLIVTLLVKGLIVYYSLLLVNCGIVECVSFSHFSDEVHGVLHSHVVFVCCRL